MKPSCVLDFLKKQTNKKPHAQLKGTVALWLFGFFGNVGLKIKFKTCGARGWIMDRGESIDPR